MVALVAAAIGIVVLGVLLIDPFGDGGGDGSEARTLLNMTPTNAEDFWYIDLQALRDQRDLRDVLENVEDDLEELIDEFEIDLDEVEAVAIITIDGDSNLIVRGDLNRDDLIKALKDEDFDEGEMDDVTVWEGQGFYEAVAFLQDGHFAFGYLPKYVEDIVQASTGERRSLADRDNIDAVFDRLATQASSLSLFVSEDCFASRCRAFGESARRMESDIIEVNLLFLFRSGEDAEDGQEEIEDELLLEDARNVEYRQDGNFVEVRFEMDVEDFLAEEEGVAPGPSPTPVAPGPSPTPTEAPPEPGEDGPVVMPSPRPTEIPREDHLLGSADAPVTVVTYADFQ